MLTLSNAINVTMIILLCMRVAMVNGDYVCDRVLSCAYAGACTYMWLGLWGEDFTHA